MTGTNERITRAIGWLARSALLIVFASHVALADDDSRRQGSDDDAHQTSTDIVAPAASSPLQITLSRWNASRRRVEVSGLAQYPGEVTVVNAFDPSQELGNDDVSTTGRWWVIKRPSPVPCRVRAIQSDGQTAEADVDNAPSDCAPSGSSNLAPTANANGPYSGTAGVEAAFSSAGSGDTDGTIVSYSWDFGDSTTSNQANPSHTYAAAGNYPVTLTVVDDDGDSDSDSTSADINDAQASCSPANLSVSINSTAQDGCPDGTVPERPQVANTSYSVLAINDLGMHCGDLDTRIASILPPFQVLLAQVVQKGGTPILNPQGTSIYYSAVSNPNDPILNSNVFDGVRADGDTYKTNFWDYPVVAGTYDPFYPGFNPFNPAQTLTPLAGPPFNVTHDVGLPVPNVEDLYIGPDGQVNSGDEFLSAVQHAMPGIALPYTANDPLQAEEHYVDKPFFVNFPFGYVAEDVNWFEGAGIPFAAFDDNGRENAYPLVRVEARDSNGSTLSTVDTVLPISGEASCVNCHADPADLTSVTGRTSNSTAPTDALTNNNPPLPVVTSLSDPDSDMPARVSLEYAADINTLRLHDLRHGAAYVAPSPADDGTTVAAPCSITANNGDGDANCLTNQALVQGKPVVCQVCHYTPALDLAHLGPLTGPAGGIANGRNQLAHSSNSNVMHSHHGSTGAFPAIPAPIQAADGSITNQAARLDALENSCYQCHPGTNVQCLRGAMFNGGMLCSDCHGGMQQVGADFSQNVSPTNPAPGSLLLGGDFYDPADPQPRVPWANEPGCGSCHTGDANNSLAGTSGTLVNNVDTFGNTDGIRLRQAFRTGDAKATPIVPGNKRFAEPAVPASFNGTANKGAGNPQLYRVSTGHGGVMCEGCHGATHSEWPNANPNSNDNIAAAQLQGHTGTLAECDTCHVASQIPSNTQAGPHGMHVVNDSRFWRESHKGMAETQNRQPNGGTCGACHGSDHLGTVLSRASEDRAFSVEGSTRRVSAGEPVACNLCHSLAKSFGND